MQLIYNIDNPFPISGTYAAGVILDLDEEKLPGELEGMVELDFSSVKITNLALGKISKALCSNKSICSITLFSHELDDRAGNLLFSALKTNSRVEKLNLNRLNMSKENWLVLSELLAQNTNLSYLRIVNCKIENDEVEIFAKGLEKNTSLKTLELNANAINETGGLAIAQALKKNPQLRLTNFVLTGNFDIGTDACFKIMQACRFLRDLKKIDLSHNAITDKAPFLKILDECPQVEALAIESKYFQNPYVRNEVKEIIEVNNTKYLRLQYILAFYLLMKDNSTVMAIFPKELRNLIMRNFIDIDFENIEKLRTQYEYIDNPYPQPKDRFITDTGVCFTYPSEEEALRAFASVPKDLRVEDTEYVYQNVKRDKATISIGKLKAGANVSFPGSGVHTSHKDTVAIDCFSRENAKIMYPLFFSKTVGVRLGTNYKQKSDRAITIYCENPGIFKKIPKPLVPVPVPEQPEKEICLIQ